MAHQTLKRQFEDLNPNNDNLNDDEYDVTWGGKRSRYIYNYTLQSDLFSTYDSDQTESVHSVQSKSTIGIVSDADIPSESSCGSDCNCQSSQFNQDEFDVRSLSSSPIDFTTSDSSTTVDYNMDTKNDNTICDKTILDSDNGYFPEDTDIQSTTPKKNLPPPACFKFCLQCYKENANPYFQYCFTCFRDRMEHFENKPTPKQKKAKRFNLSDCSTEGSPKDSQESNSSSIGISSLNLFQKQNDNLNEKNIDNQTSEILGNIENICNICFNLPKNGVFNHGKIGHIYCCYPCAKKVWKTTNKCPICNIKIKFVTKLIVV